MRGAATLPAPLSGFRTHTDPGVEWLIPPAPNLVGLSRSAWGQGDNCTCHPASHPTCPPGLATACTIVACQPPTTYHLTPWFGGSSPTLQA